MDNAQNIEDWGIQQMTVANTRIPYASTLLQTDPVPPTPGASPKLYGMGGPKGPALPNPQPFVRGEKQWMDNAQNIEDWGIQQMTVANTRIPYASTLVQLNTDPVPPTPGAAPAGVYGFGRDGAQLGGPAYPNPQPFVRGEKQWMDNAQNIEDWGIHQMEVANARIPYASTLLQLGDDKKDDEPDYSLLYEKEIKSTTPEKVMTLSSVPRDAQFIQQDNDPKNIEGFLMEDPNIPLNLRLVQTKQDDDPEKMESMVMEDLDIPKNMRLIHIKNQQGDELIRIEN